MNLTEVLKDLLIGIRLPPFVVGQARGIAVGLVLAMAAAGAKYIGGVDFTVLGLPQELAVLIGPAGYWAVRSMEGAFDQQTTPHQNDIGVDFTEVDDK